MRDLLSYRIERHGSYYCSRRVPAQLRDVIGGEVQVVGDVQHRRRCHGTQGSRPDELI
jgi:hypothetical protein